MLYGEARLSGGYSSGADPYQILPVMPSPFRPAPMPIAVVRATYHRPIPELDAENMKTRLDSFHGGEDDDEIAAPISLALRTRCRSGGTVRQWFRDMDLSDLGQPIEYGHRPPALQTHGTLGSTLLPFLNKDGDLSTLGSVFDSFFNVESPKRAAAMIKAARLYQEAIWIGDEDPNLAFLWLVGAIEVAAGSWRSVVQAPSSLLKENMQEVSNLLLRYGEAHHEEVAAQLAHLVKSTQKFVEFTMEYLPEPPETRPSASKIDWLEMPRYLRKVYTHRSNALHVGTPFPYPMCIPGHRFPDGTVGERPLGEGGWALGGEWKKDDLPMTLATFEYICWSALRSWFIQQT